MMTTSGRRTARIAAGIGFAAALLSGSAASAQIGDLTQIGQDLTGTGHDLTQVGQDLLPPLDGTLDPDDLLPTPDPTDLLDDAIDDTTETVDDTLDTLTGDGGGEAEPGTDDPATNDDSPTRGTDGAGDDATTGSDSTDSGPGGGIPGATTDTGIDRADPTGTIHAGTSYGAAAGRAALATATRAIRLAGPLAAPLLFGALAVAGLIALGRGSDGLIKLEHIREGTRRFRL